MIDQGPSFVRRSSVHIAADRSRVVTRLFVPGHEGFDHQESRSAAVLRRLLDLSDEDVQKSYDDVHARFEGRHHGLAETFLRHADELSDRLDPELHLSPTRRLLLGATFTSEYAIEGAALCNPSMVLHPDQTGVPAGTVRFIMSVRAIGEGHSSSIGFRTGTVTATGDVSLDPRPTFASTGRRDTSLLDAQAFKGELRRVHGGGDDADYVLGHLGPRFSDADLERRLRLLEDHAATRKQTKRTVNLMRRIAERSYCIRFEDGAPLNEQVLLPTMSAESKGMEDARFVRFVHDDGSATYLASYTAYNGTDIGQQLLETQDFRSFTSSPMVGAAAANKGLALFPRRIDGRFAALSRSDRESNTIAYTLNPNRWEEWLACQTPTQSWEVIQLGNCGSPIETEAGWLVLTHGVGPMRTYSIGAILLDLEDPTQVIGRLREPLLSPAHDEQDGYVPNVVYSCGAFLHAGTLAIPYGIGDSAIGVATVPMAQLLASLTE
ncbi:MAG TPA: glycoside hydrolase family 130 protein [Acidimicrobiales bacterium]|nr:glycoside hydrolase family 130 protein [Acidimicrobiales bacterium]